jgi:hypothetical protein
MAAGFAARFSWYAMGHDVDPWTYRFFPFEIGLFVSGHSRLQDFENRGLVAEPKSCCM